MKKINTKKRQNLKSSNEPYEEKLSKNQKNLIYKIDL